MTQSWQAPRRALMGTSAPMPNTEADSKARSHCPRCDHGITMERHAHRLRGRGIALVTLSLIALLIFGMLDRSSVSSDPKERGKALVEELCAGCHAVGRSGESPLAGAPAFRMLSRRFDMNELMDRMEQGLSSAHAEMPAFHFKRDDARAVRVYLNSIQD